MAKESRRDARRNAARKDRDEKESGGGFMQRPGYTVKDEVLDDLGVSEYRTAAGEDGEEKLHKVHLLPANADDPDLVALKLYVHYDIGPDGAAFLCPRWMKKYLADLDIETPKEFGDGACPACEEHDRKLTHYKQVKDKVGQEERDALWAELKALHPYGGSYLNPQPKRMLAWVVDATSDDTMDEGVKFWLMPTSVYHEGVTDLMFDEDEVGDDGEPVFVDILDPDKGHMFLFKRKGKGMNTKYGSYRIKKRGWSVTTETDWLKKTPCYFDVLKPATYDEIQTAMDAEPAETAEADEPERVKDELADEYKKGSDRPRPRRRRDEETKDDKEETERPRSRRDEKDDDTDTETPRRRGRREDPKDDKEEKPRRRRPREEPDDDDDEVSDEAKEVRERIRERAKVREGGRSREEMIEGIADEDNRARDEEDQ